MALFILATYIAIGLLLLGAVEASYPEGKHAIDTWGQFCLFVFGWPVLMLMAFGHLLGNKAKEAAHGARTDRR